jgi:hypothetical protein
MCQWLGPPEAMPIIQNLNSSKIGWGDFGYKNPNKLIETRAKMVVEKPVFELLPEILNVHGGSKT